MGASRDVNTGSSAIGQQSRKRTYCMDLSTCLADLIVFEQDLYLGLMPYLDLGSYGPRKRSEVCGFPCLAINRTNSVDGP